MSSHTHQKKTAQHPNTPTTGYCEDYNGYTSQYYVKDHLLPKDLPMGNHQPRQNQVDDKMKLSEYMGIQGHRSDSLEYLQWQDKKGAFNQETSPNHNISKNLHDSTGSNKFNNSLEAIPSDIKHNIKDKVQLPTFGDDQLNMVVAQQQANSPRNNKKSNVSKIEQLLEQHKKRKAQQKFNELKNETDCVSPISEKFVPSRDSDRIPYALVKEQDLFVNIIEGEWPAGMTNGHNRERGSFGAQSFGIDYVKSGSNPGGQTERKGLIDVMSEHNSNAGETGRFKGSPRWNEVVENVERQESERKEFEVQNISQTNSTSDRKSNRTSSRNTSQDLSPKSRAQANVPRMSKNSEKIFRNSQRAKEDEKMIQELLATKIRQISSAETMESAGLQRIPEENESLDKSNNGSPKSRKRTLDTEEDKVKSNWSLAAEGLVNETLSLPKIRTISDNQSFRFTTGDESPKRYSTKRNVDSYDPNTASTSSSYVSSPKNLKGTTFIEHKKPPVIDPSLFLKKAKSSDKSESPSRKEVAEIAKSPKQIYLKVVDNTKDPAESPRKSAKGQRESLTPEPRKSAKNSKVFTDITPEELAKYDEVQRLEIIKNNLQHLQRANLLAQLHALRLSNSKSLDSPKSPKTPPQDWNLYAEEINNGARRTRTTKQGREKPLQAAKSASPRIMEKVNITVESLFNSAQLRQHLPAQTESDEDIKNIWRHENGLRRSWAEDNMYDRNQKWLMVKKYKVDQINESLSWEEMKDCSFKPAFVSRNYNSLVASPQRSHTEASQSNYNSLTDRLPIETNRYDLGAIVSERNASERKSLYKDRRNKESYSGLFDLKKNYNLYKGESVSYRKSEAVNSSASSGMRRKNFA